MADLIAEAIASLNRARIVNVSRILSNRFAGIHSNMMSVLEWYV